MNELNLLILLSFIAKVNSQFPSSPDGGRNVIIGHRDRSIISTFGNQGLRIRRMNSNRNTITVNLPNNINSFDDLDRDGRFIYTLSTTSRIVCSYRQRNNRSLQLIGCVGNGAISAGPFCGISVFRGNLIVSGGTGGFSYFRYNRRNGEIDPTPVVLNQGISGIIGLPDVTMISSDLIAFSTDFSSSNTATRFGILIAAINGDSVNTLRDFRIDGSRFDNALTPANFALVSDIYENDAGEVLLFVAHGVMIVVDPTSDESDIEVLSAPMNSIEAVTVAVDSDNDRVYFAGIRNNNEDSAILEFDISADPLLPIFSSRENVSGRIISIAVTDGVVSYVLDENRRRIRTSNFN